MISLRLCIEGMWPSRLMVDVVVDFLEKRFNKHKSVVAMINTGNKTIDNTPNIMMSNAPVTPVLRQSVLSVWMVYMTLVRWSSIRDT